MEFQRFQSTLRLLSGILLTISMASCHYNKSFNGYTFVLPEVDGLDQSNRRSLMMLSFQNAQRWCKENVARSTLASIPNKDVQRDLALFIESAIKANENMHMNLRRDINNIRVNAKHHVTGGWNWINGNPERQLSNSFDNQNSYARLWGENRYPGVSSAQPHSAYFYICEHSAGISIQCNTLLENGKCYRTGDRRSTWYDARNDCLDGGGDLASFENFNQKDIKKFTEFMSLNSSLYWIGMQRNEWRWEDTGSDIKYSYWINGYPNENNGDCLCLNNIGGWKWRVCDCSTAYPFICLLNDTSDSSALTDSNESRSTEFIIMAVSCAAIFVVIVIISAVLIIRKRKEKYAQKRDFESRSAEGPKSSGYEAPNHTMESSTDPPVYEEIQEPKRIYCASDATYASVEMTSTAEDKHPVNNIVYAELDLISTA